MERGAGARAIRQVRCQLEAGEGAVVVHSALRCLVAGLRIKGARSAGVEYEVAVNCWG